MKVESTTERTLYHCSTVDCSNNQQPDSIEIQNDISVYGSAYLNSADQAYSSAIAAKFKNWLPLSTLTPDRTLLRTIQARQKRRTCQAVDGYPSPFVFFFQSSTTEPSSVQKVYPLLYEPNHWSIITQTAQDTDRVNQFLLLGGSEGSL